MIDMIWEDTLSGIDAPNHWRTEIIDKINEMIEVLNKLERDHE